MKSAGRKCEGGSSSSKRVASIVLVSWLICSSVSLCQGTKDSELADLSESIGKGDCWCIVVVPKIAKGGDLFLPVQKGSKVLGSRVGTLYAGYDDSAMFLKMLKEGFHKKLKSTDKIGKGAVEQYTVFFLMEKAPSRKSEVLSLSIHESGEIVAHLDGEGFWLLDKKFGVWIKSMLVGLGEK